MFEVVEDLSSNRYAFLCFELKQNKEWDNHLAKIYAELRGEIPAPINPLIFDGIQILVLAHLPEPLYCKNAV